LSFSALGATAPTALASTSAPALLQAPNVQIRWQGGTPFGRVDGRVTLHNEFTSETGVRSAFARSAAFGLTGAITAPNVGMLSAVDGDFANSAQARGAAQRLFASLGSLSKDTFRQSYGEPFVDKHHFSVGVAAGPDAAYRWYRFSDLETNPNGGSAREALKATQFLAKVAFEHGV